MLDMNKFIYVKADPRNTIGYDLYVVKKCSCEKNPIVVGLPTGRGFMEFMQGGSYNLIKRINPADTKSYSQMFFVPREEIGKRNFVK